MRWDETKQCIDLTDHTDSKLVNNGKYESEFNHNKNMKATKIDDTPFLRSSWPSQ